MRPALVSRTNRRPTTALRSDLGFDLIARASVMLLSFHCAEPKKIGGIGYPLCRRRTTYGEHPVQGCNRAFEIRVHPVTGKLCDVDHEKAVFLAEASEIGETRHGAVV